MKDLAVLRIRKSVPGVGRKVARHFDAQEVVCGFKPTIPLSEGTVIFNYGRSVVPVWAEEAIGKGCTILNKPSNVINSVDKRRSLSVMSAAGVPTLEHTTDRNVALGWVLTDGDVVVRHKVKSKQGKGVEVVERGQDLPHAPLYTRHYKKTHEFRVHVFQGKVIDLVQKKRMGKKKLAKLGLGEAHSFLRNHKQGYVFAHNELVCDFLGRDNGRSTIEQIGIDATEAIGLDYCGVDILARYDDQGLFIDAVVCETNSAPGMSSPTTFKAYADAIEGLLKAG